MIRFLLRFIGLILIAVAFIVVIYDGTKSIAGNAVSITSVQALWGSIHAASLQNLRPRVIDLAGTFVWDSIVAVVLAAPSWLLLAGFGVFLILLGRKKKPLIGYAR